MKNNIIALQNVGLKDIDIVGGKNASLGEMINLMGKLGINVPGGFALTTSFFKEYFELCDIDNKISSLLKGLDVSDIETLNKTGSKIRKLIIDSVFPESLKKQVLEEFRKEKKRYKEEEFSVAVRSSATAEDLPDASFAGQQDTYLNIESEEDLIMAIKKCFASLYNNRAISYRSNMNYHQSNIYLSVCIQKMVRSDLGVSGVAFSLDTESGFDKVVLINANYGLGEPLVQGEISPDEFLVFKENNSIIEKKLGTKLKKMVFSDGTNETTEIIHTNKQERSQFCLSNNQIVQISKAVKTIETYYSDAYSKWCPVDVEWAFDHNNKLYIVQARPETVQSNKDSGVIKHYEINKQKTGQILLSGIAVGDRISTGKVSIINNVKDIVKFKAGDILVTDMTDPDWEPIMKIASGIITNRGGRTCHAAIVARELGVPAIVGTETGNSVLKNNESITVSCAEGEKGFVYEGIGDFRVVHIDKNDLPKIETPLMLNVASPDLAFKFSFLPNKGVGLAREEFIINNYIKIHPLALLNHKSIQDKKLSSIITETIRGYNSEKEFFIEKLSYGIAKIAAAFHEKPVIVRFSDFKSNEYRNLLGGEYFEPNEENPMIGWRGASRYYSKEYKKAFGLECEAIKKVRNELGFKNVRVMIPFCRTITDCKNVIDTMAEFGLERGKNGLEIYLMAEVPSNFILADKFAEYVDGFSIGSNDLTQLTLGLDRDSSLVAHLYDERNEAIKEMITLLMDKIKGKGVKVGICGQAPSDFPEFAQFLVKQNIGSISVTPDSILKTLKAIYLIENNKEVLATI